MRPLVDILGDIVAAVRTEYDPGGAPYYLYGHPLDVFNVLSNKGSDPDFKEARYPTIALYLDYEEENTVEFNTVRGVTIAIITETSPTFVAEERYDNVITPILQPLYELLIKHIEASTELSSDDKYKHTKKDRLYYGKEDTYGNSAGISNDKLDAIIITNLNLKILKTC